MPRAILDDAGELRAWEDDIAGEFTTPVAARRRARYLVNARKTDGGYARVVHQHYTHYDDVPAWCGHWEAVDDEPEIVD